MPTTSPRDKHGIGVGIVERNARQVDLDALPADEAHGALQHRQRLQAKEVELHQPRLLDIFHVELGDRHVGARVAVHRHQFRQRPVADHDAGGVRRGVPVEALELLRHAEQGRDDRLLLGLLGKARLALDRLGERHRIGGVLGNHLAQPVDLAVGHLEHPADIAQHRARLQRAKGDDLRDLVAAVFFLDVADDLVAAVLAEIDVEVGHRHAVGIEEPLEQQREAQRIDVGNGGGPGDQRAGARAAPRADRNPFGLRPFDEIGDDQEIAGIFHLLDDAELEIEPFAILRGREAGARPERGKALLQPCMRLPREFGSLGPDHRLGVGDVAAGEARQDRGSALREERAPPRDLDRVLDRLRNIGEKRRHLALALQEIVRCQAAAVVDGDHRPFGDGDQRVVRLIVAGGGEKRLVGRHQRQFVRIGQVDRLGLDGLVVAGKPFELHIEPVAEDALQDQEAAFGQPGMSRPDGLS